jgi:hypothetical protein
MRFTIDGLDPAPFLPLFDLPAAELAARDMRRRVADETPGYPCRVSLEDAAPGEEVLLVPFRHHAVASPYRGEGPVYVRRAARASYVDELPPFLAPRLLSVRAYNRRGMMIGADVTAGRDARPLIDRLLALAKAAYLHVHFAQPGCFACRIDPVQ